MIMSSRGQIWSKFYPGAVTKYLNMVLENETFIFLVNEYVSDVIYCL